MSYNRKCRMLLLVFVNFVFAVKYGSRITTLYHLYLRHQSAGSDFEK